MEGPAMPPAENPNHNVDGDANQANQINDNNDNNVPAGPQNAPPNQSPSQPAPQQPPQHPVPHQPLHSNLFQIGLSLFCTNQPLR